MTTAADGKKYKTKYYNLNIIISVGYRVKSKQGTQFRIWANSKPEEMETVKRLVISVWNRNK